MKKVDGDNVPMETPAPAFTRDQVLASKRYANRRDALGFLLKDGETYTAEQIDTILINYMKGKVK